ncbi:carbohydrate ABC transporter permease [Pseudonocardia alaniniphila]|uniref:Carbohydrate ABC transporter permease n=1 Tax=Pseudonocardia alaniniphila TaxID=75291 RepID=A0ABS9TCG0_9PSEU|nr:carbohydrate ABC transporter permease [Pseudonocardia alaniniphila]MCH6166212.1 carbohydrate ABC transporter permease [Pseudonocardia alaniniphila]
MTIAAPRSARTSRTSTGRQETWTKRVLYAVGGGGAFLVFTVPLVWALLRSVQPNEVIVAAPDAATFLGLTFENFHALLSGPDSLVGAVANSLIVALGTAALTTVLATAAGYGFARFRLRSGPVLFALVVASMMVPFQAILTPLYLQMNLMRLTDSLVGLVLFCTTVNLPFGVLVMRNSFSSVPGELEDSAHIDGASTLRIITSVLRPLITPGAATVALYAFLAAWTEFLGALTFLTDRDLYTLPVALVNLQQGAYGQINFGYLAAGSVIAMIPCVVLYVALQRFYVAGLASGAVKG